MAGTVGCHLDGALKNTDTVIDMDNEIAGVEFCKGSDLFSRLMAGACLVVGSTVNITVGNEYKTGFLADKTAAERERQDGDPAFLKGVPGFGDP